MTLLLYKINLSRIHNNVLRKKGEITVKEHLGKEQQVNMLIHHRICNVKHAQLFNN